jgi:hypothetical protein
MVLYKAGRQFMKVRFIMILSLLCATGSVWWGIDLAKTYGLNPGDGGVLAPLVVRLVWGTGVSVLGIAFMAGMWLYSRNYVARLEYDEQSNMYTVRHIGFFGTTKSVFCQQDIVSSRFHRGRLSADIQVNAPWWTIHIAGRRKPLILDAQGIAVEEAKLRKVLGR